MHYGWNITKKKTNFRMKLLTCRDEEYCLIILVEEYEDLKFEKGNNSEK